MDPAQIANGKSQMANGQTQQDAQMPVAPQQQVSATVTPYSKEQAPTATADVGLTASEQEPVLHPEVAHAGVEIVSEKPPASGTHERLGIRVMGDTTPVQTQPSGTVQLPMQGDELKAAEKAPVTESKRWLATLITYLTKKMNKNK